MDITDKSFTMNSTYEEEFMGFEIYVEPNPDKWRGGFIWSVCKNEEEIDSDLEFDFMESILSARKVAVRSETQP